MLEYEKSLKCITSGRSLTIYLEGDIDHHNARTVRSKIDTKLYIQRPDELVLDLSRVNFMDSSGLGLILGRYNRLKSLGAELYLESPTVPIEKILHLAGVERIIPILKKDQKERSQHEKREDQ
jgi:stage II sporulation protein AA (anti-sigma F factor antagonist)